MELTNFTKVEVLKDEFSVVGTDAEAFRHCIEGMTEMTNDFVVRASDVTFLSPCRIPSLMQEGKLTYFVLNEANVEHFRLQGETLHTARVQRARLAEELVKEAEERDELLAIVDGKMYFISNLAITTLMARTGVTGDSTVTRANIFRDMHLADAAFARNENIHFVYREVDKMRKVFACLGGTYKLVPQTILSDIIDKFREEGIVGRIDVHDWSMDHSWTKIYIDFPDMAEDFQAMYGLPHNIIPGLLLQTSDVGLCSVTIRATYRIGRSYVIADEVTQKHTLSASADDIKERVDKEILAGIRKLPETLVELLGYHTFGDEHTDLSNPVNAGKNFRETEKVIRDTAALLSSVLTAKHLKPVTEALVAEINPEAHYTLYDVATTFMGLADRLDGASKSVCDKVRRACAQVPMAILEAKLNPEEEREIILLSA